jgi:hypothetical protein
MVSPTLAALTVEQLVQESDRIGERYEFSTPSTFLHIVTLIKRSTGDEVSFKVETESDRFSDVMLAINIHRAAHRLFGYELFEALPCNEPPF